MSQVNVILVVPDKNVYARGRVRRWTTRVPTVSFLLLPIPSFGSHRVFPLLVTIDGTYFTGFSEDTESERKV